MWECDRCLGMLGCDRVWDVEVRSFLGDVESDRFFGCWSAIVVGMLGCDRCFGMWESDRFWDVGSAIVFGMWECDRLKLGLCAIAFAKRVLCTQR